MSPDMRTHLSLVDRNNLRAEETRQRALFQGLSRFPLDGSSLLRGPDTVDRYDWPERTVVELIRELKNPTPPKGWMKRIKVWLLAS